MKRASFLGIAAVIVLSLGMVSSPTASAQSPAFIRSPHAQEGTQQQALQKFEGTIVLSGSKYILQDKASGATYQLDNQDKAKQFVGKDVKVTGTLDPKTNTIEVSDIQAQAS